MKFLPVRTSRAAQDWSKELRINNTKVLACLVAACTWSTVGVAVASPMDLVSWYTDDSFPGPDISSALWDPYARPNMQGTTSIGSGGLTMSVSTQNTPTTGISGVDTGVATTLMVGPEDSFAAQVPFSTIGSALPGGAVFFGISLSSTDYSRSYSIDWVNGNAFSGIGNGTFTGTAILLDGPIATTNPISTMVTAGRLGLLLEGGDLSMYYDVGGGWTSIGAPISTATMTGPLRFDIEANFVAVPTDFTAVSSDVQFGVPAAAVPEPVSGVLLLAGLGIIGALQVRRGSFRPPGSMSM